METPENNLKKNRGLRLTLSTISIILSIPICLGLLLAFGLGGVSILFYIILGICFLITVFAYARFLVHNTEGSFWLSISPLLIFIIYQILSTIGLF